MLIYMYTYTKFRSLFLIYDWPSSVTRPARKMLKARQKGRFITHIHIYTNTPMQAVRRLETVESSPALTHSFALHDRRFITAMYAISLAHTPAQTVFGVALGWVSKWVVGRSLVRSCESEQASAAAVTHTLFDWVFYFLFGFPCFGAAAAAAQHRNILHSIVFVTLCKSDVLELVLPYGLPFVCVRCISRWLC